MKTAGRVSHQLNAAFSKIDKAVKRGVEHPQAPARTKVRRLSAVVKQAIEPHRPPAPEPPPSARQHHGHGPPPAIRFQFVEPLPFRLRRFEYLTATGPSCFATSKSRPLTRLSPPTHWAGSWCGGGCSTPASVSTGEIPRSVALADRFSRSLRFSVGVHTTRSPRTGKAQATPATAAAWSAAGRSQGRAIGELGLESFKASKP